MGPFLIIVWVLSFVLAIVYGIGGWLKVNQPAKAQQMGATMRAQSVNKLRLIGGLEIAGAVGLLVPPIVGIMPWVAGVVAVGFIAIQAIAMLEHVAYRDAKRLFVNVALFVAAIVVAAGRFSGL